MDPKEEQRIAEWYNALARSYDELYGREQTAKHKAVLGFFESKRLKLLVDVGCGSGTFLQDADSFYDYAVGIDLSIKMLEAAKKKRSSRNDLILATSRMIPIRDEAADGLVSISTHADDSSFPSALDELRRICHENATLAISLLQPAESSASIPFERAHTFRISNRETVYCFRLNK